MTKVVGRVSRYTSLRLKTGEEKYFGSVSVTTTQEYSFYTNGILCDKFLIEPEVFVIFELDHPQDKSEPEAINIELVTDSDLETLSKCAQSNEKSVWELFFNTSLYRAISNDEKNDEKKDTLIKLCFLKLKLLNLLYKSEAKKKIDLLKSIPDILYLESTELCKELEQLETEDYSELYNDIPIRVYIESKSLRNKLKDLMASRILTTEAYWNIYDQIYQECTETEKIEETEEIVDEVSIYIKYRPEQEQNTLIHELPNNLKGEPKIFQSFKPKVQVDFIWDSFKANSTSEWDQLSNKAKIYSLYRAFEEKVCITDLIKKISQDDDALISFAVKLFSHKKESFEEIHKSLLTLIIKYEGNRESLSPFFDFDDQDYNIYSGNDDQDDSFSENKSNQNLDDNDDLSDDLSDDLILKNFLYNKNVKIVCDDGEELNPKEYIKKIEDWMDLVSKNSDRLKCSSCQKFMNFDPKYTIHSQIYEITLFHCPDSPLSDRSVFDEASGLDGSKHNYNVYISHCWNRKCRAPIDSRKSFEVYGKDYRDQGWVKCAKCGAGKKPGWDR